MNGVLYCLGLGWLLLIIGYGMQLTAAKLIVVFLANVVLVVGLLRALRLIREK